MINNDEENILCNVFAISLESNNSAFETGVTNIVDIVDSLFSKYITEPTYINDIIVASSIITSGSNVPRISALTKNNITPHINATSILINVILYLFSLINSPFTSIASLLFIFKLNSGYFNKYVF